MQINTNVSHRTYTSYKSNTNEKYLAGYSKNNDGSLITNEPVQESGFIANYMDYQEFHRLWMFQNGGQQEVDSEEAGNEQITDYHEMIKEKINEIYVKIQNGDTEPTYQIGAQSFTEKEWDDFLEKFDSMEDAIRELMREEHEKREEEQIEKAEMEKSINDDIESMLLSESTMCSYPTTDPEEGDILYITWYTEEGIFCRKAGQTEGYEWSITFENSNEYDKVMEFIRQFSSDKNLRFAAHENFWRDFLNDEIDIQGFLAFFESTNNGIPDYSVTIGDSMYIDKEKVQYAKYMNPLGTQFYTQEEMLEKQREIIKANAAKCTKLTNPYTGI